MTDLSDDRERGTVPLPRGGHVAYEIHGCTHGGTPVLLIRPLGGSMLLWGRFRTQLARWFRVVSFDLRGTGRSTGAHARVTTEGIARDGLHLLARLGVGQAHVFGISLGGMAATWLAILDPTRVARLCIASAPERGLDLSHTGLRRELALAACFAAPQPEVEVRLVDRILSPRFRAEHPDEVTRIEGLVRAEAASRGALFSHALAGLLHDARGQTFRIAAPTLVLVGDSDTLLGHEAPRALARAIRGSTFEVIAASGHDLTLEQPDVVAARVARFFLASPVVRRAETQTGSGVS